MFGWCLHDVWIDNVWMIYQHKYGWSRKGDSLRTTLSIPEKEARPKRMFGPTNLKCSHNICWNVSQISFRSAIFGMPQMLIHAVSISLKSLVSQTERQRLYRTRGLLYSTDRTRQSCTEEDASEGKISDTTERKSGGLYRTRRIDNTGGCSTWLK